MDNGRLSRLALSRQIPTFRGNEKTLNWAVEILEIQKTGLRRIWYDWWRPVFFYLYKCINIGTTTVN